MLKYDRFFLLFVLDKLKIDKDMKHITKVIEAMREDIYREAKGEIIESKEASSAISKKTVELFKKWVKFNGW